MTYTLQRRNRRKRKPSGKRICLNERDMRILSLLYRYVMLDSADLAAFIRPVSRKRFIERLGGLYHDGGFIQRPEQQWLSFGALYRPVTYCLSKRGLSALDALEKLTPKAVIKNSEGNLSNKNGSARPQFEHSALVGKAIAQVEYSILNTPISETVSRQFVPIAKIMKKRNSQYLGESSKRISTFDLSIPVTIPSSRNNPTTLQTSIIPDGLYGIEYQIKDQVEDLKRYRFFAVEVELSSPLRRWNLVKSSFLKKLLAYKAAIHSKTYKSALGIPNLFVHFVARDEEKLSKMTDMANDILSPVELKLFRFTVCSIRKII